MAANRQTDRHTHAHAQYSHASVRLAQARPNKLYLHKVPSVWVAVVASLTGEMAAWSFAYRAHELQILLLFVVCVPWQNIKSAMYARSALPPDDKSSYVTYNYIPAVCQVAPVPIWSGNKTQ